MSLIVTPPHRERSIVINPSVCLCVCVSVHKHISGSALPIFTKLCMQIPYGCGSVLLRRHWATLCTSGFMDDVAFGRNGRYGIWWPAWSATSHLFRAWPGRSLMSVNGCLLDCDKTSFDLSCISSTFLFLCWQERLLYMIFFVVVELSMFRSTKQSMYRLNNIQ